MADVRSTLAIVGESSSAVSSITGISQALQGIDSALNLASRGFALLSSAVGGMVSLIEMAGDERTGIRQMNRALEGLGIEAAGATAAIEEFAAAQQAATRFGDTFTRDVIRRLSDGLRGAEVGIGEVLNLTGLVEDIVERTGMSGRGVARILAQAYTGNIEGLRRLLPVQSEYLNELKKTEGAAAAGAAAMQILTEQFAGSASDIDEATLAMAQLTNGWGDFKEQIGGVLADYLIEQNVFDRMLEGLNGLIEWVDLNGPEINRFLQDMSGFARSLAEDLNIISSSTRGGTAGAFGRFLEEERQLEQAPGPIQENKMLRALDALLDTFPTRLGEEFTQSQLATAEALSRRGIQDPRLEAALITLAQDGFVVATEDTPEAAGEGEDGGGGGRRRPTSTTAGARAEAREGGVLSGALGSMQIALLEAAEQAGIAAQAQEDKEKTGGRTGEVNPLADVLGKGGKGILDQAVISDAFGGIGDALTQAAGTASEAASEQIGSNLSAGFQIGIDAAGQFGVAAANIAKDAGGNMFNALADSMGILQAASAAAVSAGLIGEAVGGPLAIFTGLLGASAAFLGVLGGSSVTSAGGGGRSTTTATNRDILSGLRPTGGSTSSPVNITMHVGQLYDGDAQRGQAVEMIQKAMALGEFELARTA